MYTLKILFTIAWLYVLSVLTRSKLDFWRFCCGSVGMFLFLTIWIQPVATAPLTKAVTSIAGILGDKTDILSSYFQYGVLFISSGKSSISLYIDYECSGIIEIMAFTSLLFFFDVYSFYEKIVVSILGVVWILLANIIRIYVICILIYFFGNNIFYFAHTIFGRLVFYGFSVVLYFYVFTKSHVIRQKVGSFSYDNT